MLVFAGSFASCKDKSDSSADINKDVTGTVIGYYNNSFYSLLIQVDKKYPIGKPIEYVYPPCTLFLPQYGTYRNMIQVQAFEATSKMMNKRISFSYRPYQYEEDSALFNISYGIDVCGPPDVPIYVITDYQILN